MELALPSVESPQPPETALKKALDDFENILTEEQRKALQEIKSIPDADAVLVFTAQLDARASQFWNVLGQSFEQEFQSDISDIKRCGDEVMHEIALAKAQADDRHQQLQKELSEAEARSRRRFSNRLRRTGNNLNAVKTMQEKRRAEERKVELLKSLSSHDYLSPFKDAWGISLDLVLRKNRIRQDDPHGECYQPRLCTQKRA
ncbi:hypothetical protein VTH06DRAFT_5838 [Thermothelomyces fergusii]